MFAHQYVHERAFVPPICHDHVYLQVQFPTDTRVFTMFRFLAPICSFVLLPVRVATVIIVVAFSVGLRARPLRPSAPPAIPIFSRRPQTYCATRAQLDTTAPPQQRLPSLVRLELTTHTKACDWLTWMDDWLPRLMDYSSMSDRLILCRSVILSQ